jgi:predicted DCC family thiol-disulfide oxidoreductase YuxK
MDPAPPLLLYDGFCALCDGTVKFLLRIDRRGALRYAPLAGETAAAIAARRPEIRQVDSVALVSADDDGGERVALRSAAVVGALRAVGGGWRLAAALLALVPRPLRDWGYDFVARRRKRWFGELEACPLPPPAARSRFLP